ncbi:histidine phosphatase family protein [Candidatus Parcubacteria bacterium]|nr:histidine phosphatase family protein [Candidatus Parcubacteria bacterium]
MNREPVETIVDSDLIMGRHAKALSSCDSDGAMGPGLGQPAEDEARLVADELRDSGVDTSKIYSSAFTRAVKTAEAQIEDGCSAIETNPVLNEVETSLSRHKIAALLFLGIVPKEFKQAGRVVLEAIQKGKISGYAISHNGTIAGLRKVVADGEFAGVMIKAFTVKDGLIMPEKPRTRLRRSLVMKNLGLVAVKLDT